MTYWLLRQLRVSCLIVCGLLCSGRARAQAPSFDWAATVSASAPTGGFVGDSRINDMATDSAGNTYVTGGFRNTVRFGTATYNASNLGNDIFVAKFDARGTLRWVRQAGGNDNGDEGLGLALDARGNVYVTGYFISTTASFGSISLTSPVVRNPQVPGYAAFVAKLDSSGNWLWARCPGGNGPHRSADIAVDRAGTAYITGQFWQAATFGSTTLTNSVATSWPVNPDAFVARIDSQGNWGRAVAGGGPDADGGLAIALDAQGNVYQTGFSVGANNRFGPLTLATGCTFVSKLDAQGTYRWAVPSSNLAPGQLWLTSALAVDASGNCRFSGSFSGTYSFGSITLTSPPTTLTAYVAQLDANGGYRWVRPSIGSSNGGWAANALALDAAGNCYVGGVFYGTAQIGSAALTSAGSNDAFVGQLDAAGNWRWVIEVRGTREDAATCIALAPGRSTPSIAGNYSSPLLDFGQGLTLPGLYYSTFLTRAQPPPSLRLAGDTLLCQGGQLQLAAQTTGAVTGHLWSTGATTPSITVTAPGTYSVTTTFRGGYTLTERIRVRSISPSVQITGATAICPGTALPLAAQAPGAQSYLWSTGATAAGITVTTPGAYAVTARFGSGCAVTATHIVAANTVSISGRQQLCPGQSTTLTAAASGAAVTGYLWNTGATTATLLVGTHGTYSVTASFADGCRRTATHTVGPPVASVASVSGDTLLCAGQSLQLTAVNPDALSYRWNTGATTPGITVARPGLYAVLLTYAGGCTSRDSLLVQPAPPAPAFTLGADTTLCLEQPLVLRAPALSGPGLRYRWSDGSTGPTLTVTEPGSYALTVSSLCDTRTVARRVSYQSCLFLPNVITPNGDGQNDRFVVNGLTRGDWELTVFNRWGREVYRNPAYRHDWGADAPPGTYYYLLRQGRTSYKGRLEVVR
ncbi:gliding motility-associated C-terminal domain-containing protein [Hymenobacter sp. 15J16-1T3B]|uniref:T9SS type B sorting domain-containing protein n=1 Tax=Hymenobacter sp. 15J16-1T3B TaxID=2886941 RepID=UPI001D12DA5D|nr:gliding motility-associated C-terminal domain-containing protein [Hymenobacter sp. 15J16-1T3B]MCC3160638.1 gliding motility-associated C-terminal domain-containing protein [Hymenobacter sp. 15J16-1T3B]